MASVRAPPHNFGILLIASNVPGFAEVTVAFQITISLRVLSCRNPSNTLVAEVGVFFQTTLLRDMLLLDGLPISDSQIASVILLDAPPWAHLDESLLALSGMSPIQLNTSITAMVSDVYGDTTNITWRLEFVRSKTISWEVLAEISVTVGTYFEESLMVGNTWDFVEIQSTPEWVHFNPSTRSLYGNAPKNARPAKFSISVILTNTTTEATSAILIELTADEDYTSPTTTSTREFIVASSKHSTPAASTLSTTGCAVPATREEILRLGLGIGLSCTAVLTIMLYLIYCSRKRRKRLSDNSMPKISMTSELASVDRSHPKPSSPADKDGSKFMTARYAKSEGMEIPLHGTAQLPRCYDHHAHQRQAGRTAFSNRGSLPQAATATSNKVGFLSYINRPPLKTVNNSAPAEYPRSRARSSSDWSDIGRSSCKATLSPSLDTIVRPRSAAGGGPFETGFSYDTPGGDGESPKDRGWERVSPGSMRYLQNLASRAMPLSSDGQFQLFDRRNHVNIQEGGLHRSQRSQNGCIGNT